MKEITGAVLVCPLNWGLGHAARCIPVIHELLRLKKNIILGGDGQVRELLMIEFPELKFIEIKGINIRYNAKGFSFIRMILLFPLLVASVFREHRMLRKLITVYKIEAVISDNRYGLWSRKIRSVLITHQLNIELPKEFKWLTGLVNWMNDFMIERFDQCWVPDEQGVMNVSGELSHIKRKLTKVKYIGPLSRLNAAVQQTSGDYYDVCVLLSGPEPQRTVLEEILIRQLYDSGKTVMFVRGLPGKITELPFSGMITYKNHLFPAELKHHLLKSKYIICRSGYSSLMDLAAIGRSAIIIPTPGQSEQEYLAEFHHANGFHVMMHQHSVNLLQAFSDVQNCQKLEIKNNSITNTIQQFINSYSC